MNCTLSPCITENKFIFGLWAEQSSSKTEIRPCCGRLGCDTKSCNRQPGCSNGLFSGIYQNSINLHYLGEGSSDVDFADLEKKEQCDEQARFKLFVILQMHNIVYDLL